MESEYDSKSKNSSNYLYIILIILIIGLLIWLLLPEGNNNSGGNNGGNQGGNNGTQIVNPGGNDNPGGNSGGNGGTDTSSTLTLTLSGDATMSIQKGENYVEPGYTAMDTIEGDITTKVTKTNNVDTSKAGSYFIIYRVENNRGEVKQAIRVIKVTIDTSDAKLKVTYTPEDLTNKNVTVTLKISGEGYDYTTLPNDKKTTDTAITYKITENGTYTFKVKRKDGKTVKKTLKITNIDKTKPTGSCKSEVTDNQTVITVTATDKSGIKKYSYKVGTYEKVSTSNKYTIKEEITKKPTVILYDNALNSRTITCKVVDNRTKDVPAPKPDPTPTQYVSITGTTDIKSRNGTTTLTASLMNATATSYSWEMVSGAACINITGLKTNKSVTLTAIGSSNCSAQIKAIVKYSGGEKSATKTVTLNLSGTLPSATISGTSVIGTSGGTTTLTASLTNAAATSYNWVMASGSSCINISGSNSLKTVTLKAVSTNGCTAQVKVTIKYSGGEKTATSYVAYNPPSSANNMQFNTLKYNGMNYIISYPSNATSGGRYPLIVFLHGSGEFGTNAAALTGTHFGMNMKNGKFQGAIYLSPQCNVGINWDGCLDQVESLISSIRSTYGATKVAITGHSMGGIGVYSILRRGKVYFSSAAVLAGYMKESGTTTSLLRTPIRHYHGTLDVNVKYANGQNTANQIKSAGGNIEFIPLNGSEHRITYYVYNSTDVISWLKSR